MDFDKWIEQHSDTAIAASVERVNFIIKNADLIIINCSGGKDSVLTLELFKRELLKKEQKPPVLLIFQDPEFIFSDNRSYNIKLFNELGFGQYEYNGKLYNGLSPLPKELQKDNVECFFDLIDDRVKEVQHGEGLVYGFYKCLPISFENGLVECKRYISWKGINDFPTLNGTDVYNSINEDKNWIPLSKSRFNKTIKTKEINGIQCVPNFGIGYLPWMDYGIYCEGRNSECTEFQKWVSRNIGADKNIFNVVSIRIFESMPRRMILANSGPGGIYGYIQV